MGSSKSEPFRILPSPPSAGSVGALSAGAAAFGGGDARSVSSSLAFVFGMGPSSALFAVLSSFSPASAMLLTSLAFLNPNRGAWPGSPGLSTATKLALTLLTGLLLLETSDKLGDRPRLGGDVDWSPLALFSNMARRFRTPPPPELTAAADMTAEGEISCRSRTWKSYSDARNQQDEIKDESSIPTCR